jgi:hypothetical protein
LWSVKNSAFASAAHMYDCFLFEGVNHLRFPCFKNVHVY